MQHCQFGHLLTRHAQHTSGRTQAPRAARWPPSDSFCSPWLLYLGTFVVSYGDLLRRDDPLVRADVARLEPARVERVDDARDIEQLRAVLRDARARGLKVSISGSRHSQGGHTYRPGGVVLNMRTFNRIRAIDTAGPRITVESGATWDEVQRAIAPRGLAIKVMQSSNIFTVGGTLSANAHGRDVDVMQVVDVVERFRLLLADGRVLEVSRTENPELFSLVIGGYGMYGVILDVTLRVTRDEVYEQRSESVDYREFPAWFARRVKGDSDVVLMLARPSIDPHPDRFLREVVAVTWSRVRDGRTAALRADRGGARAARPVLLRPLPPVRLGQVAPLAAAEAGGAGRRSHAGSSRATTRCGRRSRRSSSSITARAGTPTSSRSTTSRSRPVRAVHGPLPRDPARGRHERAQLDRALREAQPHPGPGLRAATRRCSPSSR